jgi:hypothetical protein
MLASKTCSGPSTPRMPTVLPLRSLRVRTRSVANSSQQPGCTPARMVIGAPASRRRNSGPEKCMLMFASTDTRASAIARGPSFLLSMYRTSVRPSPAQEVVRHVLRRLAHARRLQEGDPRRLRRRLRGGRPGPPGQRRRSGRPRTPQQLAASHPLSSFFNSLRKRQSVPSAMRRRGADLIMPASRRRRA